jgi:hypothetical protein
MSQLQLKRISKEIIQHAEEGLVPDQKLPRVVDDYFVRRLKQDEMDQATVDPGLVEGLRNIVHSEVLPLYEQFRAETARFRDRRSARQVWRYVLGTVAIFEVIEAILTKGRSIVPTVLIPTAILYSFLGFIIYTAAQYFDELQIRRARRRLEKSIEALEGKAQTDAEYDQRRQLLDADVLRAEALEILTHYHSPEDFWRDYRRVREADPTVPGELKNLNAPGFEKFLKFHIDGHFSSVARQQRFDRLFFEAHEILLSRDRQNYILDHLKKLK